MGHALPTLALAVGLLIATPLTAAAQVAGPCPPPGGSTTETLLCDLRAVLPEECQAVDFKQVVKRIKNTDHLSFFTKAKLGIRAVSLADGVKAYDKAKDPAELERLRGAYGSLLKDFLSALGDKDPELVRDVGCVRDVGFDLLLKAAAIDNEKERNGNG
jgi:hypothetical protein